MRHPVKIASKFLSTLVASFILSSPLNPASQAVFAQELEGSSLQSTNLSDQNSINVVDQAILRKEIELERLNTNFRIETTSQDKYKRWRQLFYTEANACPTESGVIAAMCERFANLRHGKIIFNRVRLKDNIYALRPQLQARRIKHYRSEHTLEPQMVGQWIGTAGGIIELTANLINSHKLSKQGFDPQTTRKQVLKLKKETDDLLERRTSLVAALSAADASLAASEGKLLRDIEDISLLEYSRFHIGAKRSAVMQNTQELFLIYRNAIGATGNLINIISAHSRKRHMSGTGLLCTLLSGVGVVATPLAARWAAALEGKLAARKLSPDILGIAPKDQGAFESDRLALESLVNSHNAESGSRNQLQLARLSAYKMESDLLSTQKALEVRQKEQARRATIESVTSSALTGSTKIALGVCGMVAGYKNIRNPKAQDRLHAAGNTAYGIGTDLTITEGLRVRIAGEMETSHLRREHLLRGQVLQQRLKILDEMERKIQ